MLDSSSMNLPCKTTTTEVSVDELHKSLLYQNGKTRDRDAIFGITVEDITSFQCVTLDESV